MKHRLVGVIVLTAVAIICLPLLLDGDQQEHDRVLLHKPPRPVVDLTGADPARMSAAARELERASEASLPAQSTPRSDEPQSATGVPDAPAAQPTTEPAVGVAPDAPVPQVAEQPTLDADGLPTSWSLQVASFSDVGKAVRLRDDLRGKGYRSYVLNVPMSDGHRARVLIGPMLRRDQLIQIQQGVRQQFKLEGHIVRYSVEDSANLVGG